MPIRLTAPVLAVDAGKMHEIDTTNVENLYSMWTVFHRCADSIEEGRRLENLSWRLWTRETFCCESKPRFPDTPTSQAPTPRPQSRKEVPELSASVESLASTTDGYEQTTRQRDHSPAVHIRGLSSGKSSVESLSSSRGRAKPISSQTLERMVMSIKETKVSHRDDMMGLTASIPEALPTVSIKLAPPPAQSRPDKAEEASPHKQLDQRASHSSTSTAPISSPGSSVVRSQTIGSDTSAELITSHSIVRGFGPNRISSSQRTNSNLTTTHSPVPIKSVLRTRMDAGPSKGANFMLGGSSEDESSFDDQKSFRTSQSSLTAALRNPQAPTQKKMTSFKEEVESRTIADRAAADEDAIDTDDDEEDEDAEEEDDDEGDDACESAIEDEEDSDDDWEDSATDSGAASPAEKPLFQRVDSKLVSRRSLLTTGLHQADRAAAIEAEASKSQPPPRRGRTSSKAQKTDTPSEDESASKMKGAHVPRSKPIIMTTPSTAAHNALSPRTTRRNMLATELTESLRKHLLWERQQKNTTANAVLKRRHTAHDMANLKQFPENGRGSGSTSKNNSWNAYFDNGLGEYNSRGW